MQYHSLSLSLSLIDDDDPADKAELKENFEEFISSNFDYDTLTAMDCTILSYVYC